MKEPVDPSTLYPSPPWWRRLFVVDDVPKVMPPDLVYPQAGEQPSGEVSYGREFDLAIDFGTSAIAAGLLGASGKFEPLYFDGELLLESPMGRRRDLGRSALEDNYKLDFVPEFHPDSQAPAWEYFPCLKRRIEWLARSTHGTEWQGAAVLDVAAACRIALARARTKGGLALSRRLAGREVRIYITVPNAFPRDGVEVLRQGVAYGAAAALGLAREPRVRTLLEAEAVAYEAFASSTPEGSAPESTSILVIDAGAGTTDASIVRAEGGALRVLAHVGLPVGGMDLDAFLASLRGGFEELTAPEVSQRLITVRELKQRHLSETGEGSLADGIAALARDLKRFEWPAQGPRGESLEETLGRGLQRYLALAVDSLLAALPADELVAVKQVVLSGRSSLLRGFRDATCRVLAKRGVEFQLSHAPSGEERKLAVVRGVGALLAGTFRVRWNRRPARASFELVLRHSTSSEPLPLLAAGQPLIEGWGVQAWYQPGLASDEEERPAVDLRLIPSQVIASLASRFSPEELENLRGWSRLTVLRIVQQAPFDARLAFNFLTQQPRLELNGRLVPAPDQPADEHQPVFGHPVHTLRENWFELSHRSSP